MPRSGCAGGCPCKTATGVMRPCHRCAWVSPLRNGEYAFPICRSGSRDVHADSRVDLVVCVRVLSRPCYQPPLVCICPSPQRPRGGVFRKTRPISLTLRPRVRTATALVGRARKNNADRRAIAAAPSVRPGRSLETARFPPRLDGAAINMVGDRPNLAPRGSERSRVESGESRAGRKPKPDRSLLWHSTLDLLRLSTFNLRLSSSSRPSTFNPRPRLAFNHQLSFTAPAGLGDNCIASYYSLGRWALKESCRDLYRKACAVVDREPDLRSAVRYACTIKFWIANGEGRPTGARSLGKPSAA